MDAPSSSWPPAFVRSDALELVKAHRFAHQAMATVFEVITTHEDPGYAGQAARAAFDLIDRLETELTCHRSSSDISRINRLKAGESASVGLSTMECLSAARHFYDATGGAFDVSLGSGLEALELTAADLRVRVHKDGMRLDLGGLGKGYAVDRAAELLEEWGVGQALLHGGFSSVLALDPPAGREGWPLTISAPNADPPAVLARVAARREAWSASGTRKKDHIVDPRTGIPVRNRAAVWVSGAVESLSAIYQGTEGLFESGRSPSLVAEALSTAFMCMSLEQIAAFCLKSSGVQARVVTCDPEDQRAYVLITFAGGRA